MERFSEHLPSLEIVLWILASVAGLAAFFFIVPGLLNIPSGAITPASARAATQRPTLTPIPTATPVPLPPAPKVKAPVPMPTPAAGAKAFRFGADLARTGWYVTGDANPHWTDRNLHAGTYKGQNFTSVLYFELIGLAPGSRILYAEVDLTGLSRTNIGTNGSWSLKMLPSDFLTSWQDRSAVEFQSAQAIGTVGPVLTAPDLAEGQVNQFIFSHDQLAWLETAVNATGRVGFRLEGPGGVQQDLFTWDAGDTDASESIRPALRVVSVPGQFVFVTNTPTPENVLTAAAIVSKSTASVERYGTPTLFPRNYATVPPDVAITPLPTPANSETVAAQ
ncbi:MAG TPA: hypothetical protein VF932_15620, partial [Anaerolineae bacterium]